MGLIQAIVYGVVQGLTEFLPISSTAHIRIVPALLGWEDPGAAFTAVIQLGTVLAILFFFAKDLGRDFMGWARSVVGGDRASHEAKMGWAIFVGTIPIAVIGYLARHAIEGPEVRSLYVVAASLIIMGVVMFLAEWYGTRKRPMSSVVPQDGLIVGLWQCLALIPGMSRSGSTIAGALFAGFDRQTAARFSFLLSVPAVAAAGIKELGDYRKDLMSQGHLMPVVVATIVSFVVGYASIAFLLRFLQKNGLLPFVIYRILLGVVLLTLLWQGVIHPQAGVPPSPPPVTAAHGA